jgi:hypothetical protein
MDHVWVLTQSLDLPDQEGEYFVAYWPQKPTFSELYVFFADEKLSGAVLNHILKGGGRRGTEYSWYCLQRVKFGKRLHWQEA